MDALARLFNALTALLHSCESVAFFGDRNDKEARDTLDGHEDLKRRLRRAGPFANLVTDAIRFLVVEHGEDPDRAERWCRQAGYLLGRLFLWHLRRQKPVGLFPQSLEELDPQSIEDLDGLARQSREALEELELLRARIGLPAAAPAGAAQEIAAVPSPANSEAAPAEERSRREPKRSGQRAKGPTLNERMAAMFQADPSRVAWSAQRWANEASASLRRKVTASAVKDTETWTTTIRTARVMLKAERTARGR
jgi:hypothetical protein